MAANSGCKFIIIFYKKQSKTYNACKAAGEGIFDLEEKEMRE